MFSSKTFEIIVSIVTTSENFNWSAEQLFGEFWPKNENNEIIKTSINKNFVNQFFETILPYAQKNTQ